MKIEKYKFGIIEINGRVYYQDIKIAGGRYFPTGGEKKAISSIKKILRIY